LIPVGVLGLLAGILLVSNSRPAPPPAAPAKKARSPVVAHVVPALARFSPKKAPLPAIVAPAAPVLPPPAVVPPPPAVAPPVVFPPPAVTPPVVPIAAPCGRGLAYQNNSCYMDSTLVALFAQPHPVINRVILNKDLDALAASDVNLFTICNDENDRKADIELRKPVQYALRALADYIRGTSNDATSNTCVNLRAVLSKCTKSPQLFSGYGTQDAGEFLTYLFNLFQVDVADKIVLTFARKPKSDTWFATSSFQYTNESPIIDIPVNSIEENALLSSYVNKTAEEYIADWKVSTPTKNYVGLWKKTVQTYMSPYLVLRVYRLGGRKVNETPLIPDISIEMEDGTRLFLSAIVIYTGHAHYVSVIRCGDKWFFYNDMRGGGLELIGTYENMLNMKTNNPKTLGVLYFYG
jgi:hypothetical protein